MKAVIRGGIALVGISLIEAIAVLLGAADVSGRAAEPLEGETRLLFPNWTYVGFPVVIGLIVFLWTLHKEGADGRK